MPKLGQLSERERKFCIAYVNNGENGTQAAIKVGYAPNHADKAAIRLRARARVDGEIKRLMQKKIDKFEKEEIWSAEEKRQLLKAMALQNCNKRPFVTTQCINEDNKMAGHYHKEHVPENQNAQVILTMPDNGRALTDG